MKTSASIWIFFQSSSRLIASAQRKWASSAPLPRDLSTGGSWTASTTPIISRMKGSLVTKKEEFRKENASWPTQKCRVPCRRTGCCLSPTQFWWRYARGWRIRKILKNCSTKVWLCGRRTTLEKKENSDNTRRTWCMGRDRTLQVSACLREKSRFGRPISKKL